MVQRLTTLDTGFLHAEDADRHLQLGIGGLAILDGPMPDHRGLMSTLGERIAVCPRFAQRLRRRAFDLSAPEWVDDDDFNLSYHVRRVAAPAPGTDAELFAVVADIMSWRLDRNRPLWEIWLIEGLSQNRWAMLMKVHPCLADGIATVHILTGLSDNPMPGEPAPQALRTVQPAAEQPTWQRVLQGSVDIAAGTVAAAEQALRGSAEIMAGLLRPVSALNGPMTSRRRYSAARVSLADVRQICRAFDVTVNDVALAALTEGYRNMLLRRGEPLGPDSLRTLVPTSETILLPYLPVEQDNPVLRLRLIHARLAMLKAAAGEQRGGQGGQGGLAASAARLVPFPLLAWTMKLLSRLPQRSVVALAVNVPGPRQPLRVMGCDVAQVLPIPPIGLQLRTGAAILSYADELFFGILADFEALPDADELARGVEAAVARLLVRSKRRRPARDRHGLSLVVNN